VTVPRRLLHVSARQRSALCHSRALATRTPLAVTRPSDKRPCSKVRLPGRNHTADPRSSSHTHSCRWECPSQPSEAPPATCVTDPRTTTLRFWHTPGSPRPLFLSPSHGPSGTSPQNSNSAGQCPQRRRSGTFREETGGRGAAPAQNKPGRAALLMVLVNGLNKTTFPTRLCVAPAGARYTLFTCGLFANRPR
jgi:hypothetical protein